MKSYLIKLMPDQLLDAATFDSILKKLHYSLGSNPIAFEYYIASNKIHCCFTAQSVAADILCAHLYSLFPSAEVLEVADYTQQLFANGKFIGAEIVPRYKDILPIADYHIDKQSILSDLLNLFSSTSPGLTLIYQLVLLPLTAKIKGTGFLSLRNVLSSAYKSTHHSQNSWRDLVEHKIHSSLYKADMRVGLFSKDSKTDLLSMLQSVNALFCGVHRPGYNYFINRSARYDRRLLTDIQDRQLRRFNQLSTAEIATIFYHPGVLDLPNIVGINSKRQPPPEGLATDINDYDLAFVAQTNYRKHRVPFGIKSLDRAGHLAVIGSDGSGKSKLLATLIREDIEAGRGLTIVDVQGDLSRDVLAVIPERRVADVRYVDFSEQSYSVICNVLLDIPKRFRMRFTIGVIELAKRQCSVLWNSRVEHPLRHAVLAALDLPKANFLTIKSMIINRTFREDAINYINDPVVKNFWEVEFKEWNKEAITECIYPLENWFSTLTANIPISHSFIVSENKINFSQILSNNQVLIIRAPLRELGNSASMLAVGLLLTRLHIAALERQDRNLDQQPEHYLYIDQFYDVVQGALIDLLEEAHRCKVRVAVSDNGKFLFNDAIRRALFAKINNLFIMKLSMEQASIIISDSCLGQASQFVASDIANLEAREFICKLTINGKLVKPFSAKSLLLELPKPNFIDACIDSSRRQLALSRSEVIEEVNKAIKFSSILDMPSEAERPEVDREESTKAVPDQDKLPELLN